MRDKAALQAEEDLLVKGRFNVQTIVPSPQTVKPPTREGTWARKEREYHEEKERRWKEEKMRVSVAIPIHDDDDDDDDDDASDDSEGERRQRDVVSAAAARLWALAEANKRKGERVVGLVGQSSGIKPRRMTTSLPRIARAGPRRVRARARCSRRTSSRRRLGSTWGRR